MLPLVTTMPLSSTAFTALALGGARCGTKICAMYEFCSPFHSDCEDCAPICDENGHNFDKESCVSACRGEAYACEAKRCFLRGNAICYACSIAFRFFCLR